MKSYAIAGALILGYSAYSNIQVARNYVETEAVVTAVRTECAVSDFDSKLVHTGSINLAYMSCDEAYRAAAAHNYDAKDASKRAVVSFKYIPPADGSEQKSIEHVYGKTTDSYVRGYRFDIKAHKKKPRKRRDF